MRGLVLANGCWGLAVGLAALGVGSGTDPFDPGYLFLCGLLVLAPALAALPAGLTVRAPFWALEAIVSWALLGYLLLFVDPRALDRVLALALFLPALFGALASPALVWTAHAARRRGARPGRARWQGYLVAAMPCGLLLLAALGAFTPLNVLLFALIAASAQGLLLASGAGASARLPVAPGKAPEPQGPAPEVREHPTSPSRHRAVTPVAGRGAD